MEFPEGLGRLGRHARTSGALLAFALVPLAAAPDALPGTSVWSQTITLALSGCLLLAALLVVGRPGLGRSLATIGLVGTPCLAFEFLLNEPPLTLASAVITTSAVASLWGVALTLPGQAKFRNQPVWSARASGAALVGLTAWMLWLSQSPEVNLAGTVAVGWSLAVTTLLGAVWAITHLRARKWKAGALLLLTLTSCLVAWNATPDIAGLMAPLGVNAVAVLLLTRNPHRPSEHETTWDLILGHPERSFVGTFVLLCLLGTVVLALPISSASDGSVSVVDAAFTSTSAVCVTGLIVLDTPTAFSAFGQATILLLIQLGGLGVMTFYTFAAWALQRRMSLRQETAVAGMLGPLPVRGIVHAVGRILLLTLVVEVLGCLALAVAFHRLGDPLGTAVWRGLFTSISAFCNAGFALQSDSLIAYQSSPVVLHIVSLLIIVGGLSPLAVFAVPYLVGRSSRPIGAQARLCLVATVVLLVAGFFLFAAFEWNTSLAGLSVWDKLHNAWFQSVTLRTAGFNSVRLETVREPSMTLMLAWMFIGGNPGGTAGGIKTTTAAVLFLTVVQSIRGRSGIDVYQRRVASSSTTKATTVVSLAAVVGVVALLAMQLTQRIPTEEAVFEVVSALGTVGLSIGGTSQLDGVGKTIIIACMFVGRVGGLTVLMILSTKNTRTPIRWPEEEINVG